MGDGGWGIPQGLAREDHATESATLAGSSLGTSRVCPKDSHNET